MARKRIGELLIQAGVLDLAGLRAALVEQRRWGGQLGRILIDMGLVGEEALVHALSQQLNFPIVDLDGREISPDVIDLVPGELAEQHSIIPFNLEGKFLDVAMSDPTNLGIIDELRIRTQLNVRPYLAGPKMIERTLTRYYGRGGLDAGEPRFHRPMRDGKSGPVVLAVDSRSFGPAAKSSPGSEQDERTAEIKSLQERISKLEALVTRDEDVLRKLLGLLVEKGVASREEILERIK